MKITENAGEVNFEEEMLWLYCGEDTNKYVHEIFLVKFGVGDCMTRC